MLDVAWLAGLIEGEGCFVVSSPGRRRHMTMALGMTDRDVVERAARLMGSRVRLERRAMPNRKALWRTDVHGYRAVAWMMTLYSLLGQRRRARIAESLAAWRASRRRTQGNPPDCHPDRRHHAYGMCAQCWSHSEKRRAMRRGLSKPWRSR